MPTHQRAADPRPILFRGGLVRTADPAQPTAEALVVRGERVAYVGSEDEARDLAGAVDSRGPDVVDLEGRVLAPGFVDPHAHPLMLGQTASWIDCSPERTSSIAEIVDALRSAAGDLRPDRPLRGYGYQHRNLAEKRHPTRQDLDQVSQDREVYLMNASGHGGVVNSVTLARRGITRDTPDPVGGRFGRDDDGELTGELYDAACDVLTSDDGVKLGPHGPNFHLDAPDGELVEQLLDAERQFLRRGVTTIGDAQVSRREMRVFQLAARAGRLQARYAMFVLSHLIDELVALGLQSGFGDDRLRLAGVKLYCDGTLGGSTAYFPDGYATDRCQHGQLYHSRDELAQLLDRAHQAGLATATHAQSPTAIGIVLDAVDAAQRATPGGPRHRIEHAGLPAPEQAERMARLGVTTVSQPQHYYGWGEGIVESVGPLGERYNPLGEYERSGVPWALSSDAPVAPPDPLLAMEVAVTRRTRRGSVYGFPDLAVTAESAFAACTLAAARSLGMDDRVGSLRASTYADLVVMDADPVTVPVDTIHAIEVCQTWISGVRVDEASAP